MGDTCALRSDESSSSPEERWSSFHSSHPTEAIGRGTTFPWDVLDIAVLFGIVVRHNQSIIAEEA